MKIKYNLNINKKENSKKKIHANKFKEIFLKTKRKNIKIFHGNSNNYYKFNKIYIFLIFILFTLLSEEKYSIKYDFISEITLTIKGKGNQRIIYGDSLNCHFSNSNNTPDHILINGILQNYRDNIVYNLTNDLNNIILQWDHPLSSCNSMFFKLNNIIKADLSKFDTSQLTDIGCMFESCFSLESINLQNFKTSFITNMGWLFYSCRSLKSINLTEFDTSKVSYMNNMFDSCYSLISLNLNNFNLPLLRDYSYMFTNINSNLIYCIKNKSSPIFNELLSSSSNLNCSDICFTNPQHKLLLNKSSCIDNCFNNLEYPFEYNNICYNTCPNGTTPDKNKICKDNLICTTNYNYNYNKTECIDYVPEGYYINDTVHKTIDKCNIKCNNCSLESINNNNSCIKCNNKENYYPKYIDILNKNNFINFF